MHRQEHSGGVHVDADFVEADVDTGFALLQLAESQSVSGEPGDALRVVEEAEDACLDGEYRLTALGVRETRRLGPQLKELHGAIDRMRALLAG